MTKKLSRVLCAILAVAMLVGVQIPLVNAADNSFTDVPSDAWFAAPVAKAIQNGYISGMGDNRFAPYDDLTYAQVFSMVVNASYKNDESSYEFSNKPAMDASFGGSTPWWGYYAYFLNVKGLLKGTIANNNVSVKGVIESKVTRYEMVQIVYNVLNDKNVDIAESAKSNSSGKITDLDQGELTDARLALRPQMENGGRERVRRAECGRKINFWKFQGSISDADKLLGEDGLAERDEEWKRLRRMEERQGLKREARAYQQER